MIVVDTNIVLSLIMEDNVINDKVIWKSYDISSFLFPNGSMECFMQISFF